MVRGTVVKKRRHEIRRNKSIGDEKFYVGKAFIYEEILRNTVFTSCWGYETWITRGSHKKIQVFEAKFTKHVDGMRLPCRQGSKVH